MRIWVEQAGLIYQVLEEGLMVFAGNYKDCESRALGDACKYSIQSNEVVEVVLLNNSYVISMRRREKGM